MWTQEKCQSNTKDSHSSVLKPLLLCLVSSSASDHSRHSTFNLYNSVQREQLDTFPPRSVLGNLAPKQVPLLGTRFPRVFCICYFLSKRVWNNSQPTALYLILLRVIHVHGNYQQTCISCKLTKILPNVRTLTSLSRKNIFLLSNSGLHLLRTNTFRKGLNKEPIVFMMFLGHKQCLCQRLGSWKWTFSVSQVHFKEEHCESGNISFLYQKNIF